MRGIATMGPMHRMSALMSIAAGTLPRRAVTASLLPTRRSANTAHIARPMSAMKYAEKPPSHSGPASTPRYGGKITLPAPKNIANNAKPTTIMSRTVWGFVLKLHSIFLFHQLLSHLLSSASVNTLHTVTLQPNALKNVNKGYHFFMIAEITFVHPRIKNFNTMHKIISYYA